MKIKIIDKRAWKWTTRKNYNYWYCYFTKYCYTSRLVKTIKEKEGEED